MNLDTVVERIYKDLEDEEQDIWTDRSELEMYVRNGYDELIRATGCIFDMQYAENLPYEGNYNATFETGFLALILGIFSFTSGEWERDYFDNGIGPANHTAIWERSYTTIDYILATSKLDPLLVAIDRITHDNYRVLPAVVRQIRKFDGRYQYTQGPTRSWTFAEDGLFTFRKIPVPADRATTFTFSGTYGLLRSVTASEFTANQTVTGSRGVLRSFPFYFAGTGRRGFPRRLYSDLKNVRVEYVRRGRDLNTNDFEIPDRYIRYVEHYARAKCLEREGPGQDLKLAQHFMQRYLDGVNRLNERRQKELRARVGHFGTGGLDQSKPPLVKFPWPYPRVTW